MKPGLPIAVAIALCAAAGVAVIAHRTSAYERAFDDCATGDSMALVISRFGEPAHRELRGKLWPRYATLACTVPCAQRLWWEHPVFAASKPGRWSSMARVVC